MSLLKRPTGEGTLVAAFRAQQKHRDAHRQPQPADDRQRLVEVYAAHFRVPSLSTQPTRIERFSLIDPTIRTVATSGTR